MVKIDVQIEIAEQAELPHIKALIGEVKNLEEVIKIEETTNKIIIYQYC